MDPSTDPVRNPPCSSWCPRLYALNAFSLAKPHAVEQLTAELTNHQIDVAVISETHFKAKHTDDSVNIAGFNLFRRDRLRRRGGGVAVYVGEDIRVTPFNVPNDVRDYELMWLVLGHGDNLVILGAIYHPPKPSYDSNAFLDALEATVESFHLFHPTALILIAGDVNQLQEEEVSQRTGLVSVVKQPTRGNSCLDKVFTSCPCYDSIRTVTSVVKSDHLAIVASSSNDNPTRAHKTSTTHRFRRRTPALHATFLSTCASFQFTNVTSLSDPMEAFEAFYTTCTALLDVNYPSRTVTISSRDPSFITPEIKIMLREKSALMRKGHTAQAGAIALKVGRLIARNDSTELKLMNGRTDAGALWEAVRKLTHRPGGHSCPPDVTSDSLNTHFATISSDAQYTPAPLKSTALALSQLVQEQQVFHALDHLRASGAGLDGLPAWFLRIAAPIISPVLTFLFNLSLSTSFVPDQWKNALIHPLPKVSAPTTHTDFRPISIIPVLSRVLERIVVRNHIYPCLSHPLHDLNFSDQFAFRPTGSTTSALITILSHISEMLLTNPHVIMISLDLSKAFDTVRHSSVLAKTAALPLPDHIYNWLVNYFVGRKHCTNFDGSTSPLADISASVIQGSAVGPVAFAITAADCKPITPSNRLAKYADDLTLLVPSSNASTVPLELQRIGQWAADNNLLLNHSKSKAIIFSRRGTTIPLPLLPPTILVTDSAKLLGVTIDNRMRFDVHVSDIISSCAQSLFALRTLRAHGLQPPALQEVFRAVTLSKLLYASPAWWGFVQAEARGRMEAFLRRCQRFGYMSSGVSVDELCTRADRTLFKAVSNNPSHILHPLLPPRTNHNYNLRHRAHPFTLPAKDSRNFIPRMLYQDIY